jgi:hypothetical protein
MRPCARNHDTLFVLIAALGAQINILQSVFAAKACMAAEYMHDWLRHRPLAGPNKKGGDGVVHIVATAMTLTFRNFACRLCLSTGNVAPRALRRHATTA